MKRAVLKALMVRPKEGSGGERSEGEGVPGWGGSMLFLGGQLEFLTPVPYHDFSLPILLIKS